MDVVHTTPTPLPYKNPDYPPKCYLYYLPAQLILLFDCSFSVNFDSFF